MGKVGEVKKSKENEDVDRISNLPDSVICKILSLLPTKHVVGTCILSKRWKNLDPFGYVPICLDIDDYSYIQPPNRWESHWSRDFEEFVDKLLNETLHNVPCVDTLTLRCEDESYGDDKIILWVSAAIKFNVKTLILVFHLDSMETLFQSLNGCNTLGRLDLGCYDTIHSKCDMTIPDDFSLPSLKRLYLCDFRIGEFHTGSINELVNGCPVLEELEIAYCDLFGSKRGFSIESPLLSV